MKKLLFLLLPLFLVLSTIRGQTITNTSAVPHTTGTPSGAPSTYGSWIRFDKTNKILYRWTGSAWTAGIGTGVGGIYSGSGTVPGTTTATVAGGLRFNTGSTGQLLFGDYGFSGLGGSLNIQSSGTVLSAGAYGFRAQADDLYTQMVSPGYTVRLEPTTAYTLIQSTATNGYKFWDVRSTPRGVEYSADYSATYNDRSLMDFGSVKALVSDSLAAGGGGGDGIYGGSGTVPVNTAALLAGDFSLDLTGGGTRAFRVYDGSGDAVFCDQDRTLIGTLNATGDYIYRLDLNAASSAMFFDQTASPLGIQYADDYSSTIATNDRSIPDVGTVKELCRPYLVYTALLSQSGTSAPTATVLENTLGGTVVWTRTSGGIFTATLSSAFTVDKTWCSITMPTDDYGSVPAFSRSTSNTCVAYYTEGVGSGLQVQVEIRVYP